MQGKGKQESQSTGRLPVIVVKYGGNAMRSFELQEQTLEAIASMHGSRCRVVLVHGGGPFIAQTLDTARIESDFASGQRKTSPEAMPWIEMALKGNVNGRLVRISQNLGINAVGLSGKDGKVAIAEKYWIDETNRTLDLGQVGRIKTINTRLLKTLLDGGFFPILCCVALGEDGLDYNVNADVFASAVAGAIHADAFVLLTDVDGLREDVEDPDSLVSDISAEEAQKLVENGVVKGGMIPKLQACVDALNSGVGACFILNGMKPERLTDLMNGTTVATRITLNHG
ncbi:MAG: acetylglutamate kinase [Rubricoccaceae bacterium]|nr:acetylglutamate kinase [Rubricoccaceae bacterium]